MKLSREQLDSIGALDTAPGDYRSNDEVMAYCSDCKQHPKLKAIGVLCSSLKLRSFAALCGQCSRLRKKQAAQQPRVKRKLLSTERLVELGATDTSPRGIKGGDGIELKCVGCQSTAVRKLIAAIDSYRHYGFGYKCRPCYMKALQARGETWRENVKKAAQNPDRKEQAIRNGKKRIKYLPNEILKTIEAAGAKLLEGDLSTPTNVVRVAWPDGVSRRIRIRRFMEKGRLLRPKMGVENPNAIRHQELLRRLGLSVEIIGPKRARISYKGKTWEQLWVNSVDRKCYKKMRKIDTGLKIQALMDQGLSLNKACKAVGVAPVTYYRRMAMGIAPVEAAMSIRSFEDLIVIPGAKYRTTLPGTALLPDIRLPKEKLIIEIDGLWCHTEEKRPVRYHFDRFESFRSKGYGFLGFSEFEVKEKKEIVDSMIEHRRKMTPNRVGARACEVVELSFADANLFFEENHLKGRGQGRCVALMYQGHVVAALRWHMVGKDTVNISRFASKNHWAVSGAYSRLLSKLPRDLRIINFVDRRHGTGEHLLRLGFKKVSVHMGFEWTDGYMSFNRRTYLGTTGHDFGMKRVWDYGQVKYVFEPSKAQI